jgi:hypothetical protein
MTNPEQNQNQSIDKNPSGDVQSSSSLQEVLKRYEEQEIREWESDQAASRPAMTHLSVHALRRNVRRHKS